MASGTLTIEDWTKPSRKNTGPSLVGDRQPTATYTSPGRSRRSIANDVSHRANWLSQLKAGPGFN